MWKHSRVARGYATRTLRHAELAMPCDVAVQIQDLTTLRTPYLVFQDLSYDVLLDEMDSHGQLVHFPSMSRSDAQRLSERQRRIYQDAAGVLAMSQWFADHLVRVSGVPAERVHVVHPGASATATSDSVRPPRDQRRRLLLVGKDFATKAGDLVLEALALLRADVDPAITLTVVGPKEWPLPGEPPPGVRFLGRLPIDQVRRLYAEHDLFVMPSRFEGFGIALVEALSHGLPAIARQAFAMPEIVRPGDNGDLVTDDDPAALAAIVTRLLADDALYARVAEQAPGVRSHYSWSRAADDVIAVAENI
jgi:glycosyltransferase involved in cell wall biosynthesis